MIRCKKAFQIHNIKPVLYEPNLLVWIMQSTPAIILHFLILIKPPNPNVIFRFYLFTGKIVWKVIEIDFLDL